MVIKNEYNTSYFFNFFFFVGDIFFGEFVPWLFRKGP